MSENSFHFKSKIGEHNFSKSPCVNFCNIRAGFCPFKKDGRNKFETRQWTDVNSSNGATAVTSASFGTEADGQGSLDWKYQSEAEILETRQLYWEWISGGYTCWGDGSGFEFDKMSKNTIGPEPSTESIYDITDYETHHNVMQFSDWNAWVEKFQYDYRFGRVSDTNGECILFPNVDNPWMFTEYVFKGIGNDKKKTALHVPEEFVIEPPLYSSLDFSILNGDIDLSSYSQDREMLAKYEIDISTSEDDKIKILEKSTSRKKMRIVSDWDEMLVDDDGNPITSLSSRDTGVKLYCAKIPVQCIKWGEHGNIPPHTLDMTAPEDWFDPSKGALQLRAVYDMDAGIKFRSQYDGIVSWGGLNGSQASVVQEGSITFTRNTSDEKVTYNYQNDANSVGIELDMPKQLVKNNELRMAPTEKLMPSETYGEYCHGGCQHCIGLNGVLKCKWIEASNDPEEIRSMNQFFVREYCMTFEQYGNQESKCPHYLPGPRHPVIATYSYATRNYFSLNDVNPTNLAGQNAYALMGLALGGGLLGLLSSMSLLVTEVTYLLEIYQKIKSSDDISLSNQVRYEPVYGAAERPKLNYSKIPDSFGKGIQIVPGTGKFAIDSEENTNVFSGGDTNVYNDISTLSFPRFFCSVMHCASQKNCNAWAGLSQKKGYLAGTKAGGTGECRYYNSNGIGCPYNGVPKRAIEFARTQEYMARFLPNLEQLYQYYCDQGLWLTQDEKNNGEVLAACSTSRIMLYDGAGKLLADYTPARKFVPTCEETTIIIGDQIYKKIGNYYFYRSDNNSIYVSVAQDSSNCSGEGIESSSEFGGCSLLNKQMPPCEMIGNHYSLLIARMNPKSKTASLITKNNSEILFESFDCRNSSYFWYRPLTDSGKKIHELWKENTIPNLKQHWDSGIVRGDAFKGYWFCKNEKSITVPTRNTTMIDNSEKFIGGWHPEYKDYSKIGQEFMQTIDEEQLREDAVGDYIPNAGGLDYIPVENPKSQKGYWVDATGVYITDERSTGTENPIASEATRESTGGPAVCISFKKSNTTIDQNGKRSLAKTINGAVFSNDPYWLIYHKYPRRDINWADQETSFFERDTQRPQFNDPDYQDKKYYAPCYLAQPMMLPTMRHALHCPKCDYYIPYKYNEYKAKCPWCGSQFEVIHGSAGNDLEEGDTWEKDASVMKKFFKIYSIGNAEMWAPAGTCVRTDAYFWKHQTQINNAIKTQIYHRLGTFKKDKGYLFDGMSASSEFTLGLPEGIGKFIAMSNSAAMASTENGRYKSHIANGANQVNSRINPIMPYHMLPMLANDFRRIGENPGKKLDEGIILPYSNSSNDGLKMLNIREMCGIRNAVEPMYGYVFDANPSDYPTERASYDQRERIEQPIIYQHRKATVKPFVLAVTSDLIDSYQSYRSGEYAIGSVREYFPSGYTWWFMNQYIGGRSTVFQGGYYHMDGNKTLDGGGFMGGTGGIFTKGQFTTPYATLPLYGLLPLDKEIVQAYLVFNTTQCADPSKDPIGLPWGYGFLSLGGVKAGSYMYCHYHAFPKNHTRKMKYYYKDETGNERWEWVWDNSIGDGFIKHFHGNPGEGENIRYDENGNRLITLENGSIYNSTSGEFQWQDESTRRLWGESNLAAIDDRDMYYEFDFDRTMTNLSGIFDYSFHRNIGTPKEAINGIESQSENTIGFGYLECSFAFQNGFKTYNLNQESTLMPHRFEYLLTNDENNLVLKYPETKIWKERVAEEIEDEIDLYKVDLDFGISDGTEESLISGTVTTYAQELYSGGFKTDQKNISSYFDMSWANTRGYNYGEYSVERKNGAIWESPIVFQSDTVENKEFGVYNSFGEQQGGSSNSSNLSKGTLSINITEMIKKMYNKRVQRSFISEETGTTYEDASQWIFYETKLDGTLKELDDDVKLQNQQISNPYDESSYLLTDSVAYPKLESQDKIPEVDPDGDKYEISEMLSKITLSISNSRLEVGETNNQYSLSIGNVDHNGTIPQKTYESSEVAQLLKDIFDFAETKSIEKLSKSDDNLLFQITLSKSAKINNVKNNWFISSEVGEYPIKCNRIISTPKSKSGYEASNLVGDPNSNTSKGWIFKSYLPYTQSIVIDLLRAPLCISQRDYRRVRAHLDYSDVKCPNKTCPAHLKGVSLALQMKNGATFDPQSDTCPICNSKLDSSKATKIAGDGIATYKYDKPFHPDPYWTGIFIKPLQGVKCNCSISAKCNSHNNFNYVASFALKNPSDSESDEMTFYSPFKEEKGKTENYLPLKKEVIRARYVKLSCTAAPKQLFHQFKATRLNDMQVRIEGDFSNLNGFTFANLDCILGSQEEDEEEMNEQEKRRDFNGEIIGRKWYNDLINENSEKVERLLDQYAQMGIIDSIVLPGEKIPTPSDGYNYNTKYGAVNTIISTKTSSDEKTMIVSFEHSIDNQEQQPKFLKFYATVYEGGVEKFGIYGFDYKTEPGPFVEDDPLSGKKYLTVTDQFDEIEYPITSTSLSISLEERPTQIDSVNLEMPMGSVTLVQTSDKAQLKWQTSEWTFDTDTLDTGNFSYDTKKLKYRYIIGGNYFYDVKEKRIILPEEDQNGINFKNFEKELRDNNVAATSLPTKLFINCLLKNGKSITLHFNAEENGPSYMLEKNSITEINKSRTDANAFPENGTTCKLIDINNNIVDKQKIEWICYNNAPCTIPMEEQSSSRYVKGVLRDSAGTFQIPKFNGSELVKNKVNASQLYYNPASLLGSDGTECDGRCETDVTFYGGANKIISGKIVVNALPITTQTIDLGNGKSITYSERTGGILNGFLTACLRPSAVERGRKTVCYQIPKVIIYAKEINPYR